MKFRTLAQELKWDESEALDFRDIRRIIDNRGGKAHGLRAGYVDLESVRGDYTEKRFLPPGHNSCCILLSAKIGGNVQRHWVSLIRNSKGTFFFDSLSLGLPMLSRILDDKGKFVKFLKKIGAKLNTKKIQTSHKLVRTCGLHTAVRIFCWKMTNAEYLNYILSMARCLNPDQLVALLTIIGHL